jgi:hypothetical protein
MHAPNIPHTFRFSGDDTPVKPPLVRKRQCPGRRMWPLGRTSKCPLYEGIVRIMIGRKIRPF